MFPAIEPNLATFSLTMGVMEKKTKLQNLQDMTVFSRTVLTSSSGFKIKRCRSCSKDNSKSYTLGTKTKKYEHVLFFYPIKTPIWMSSSVFSKITLGKNSRLRALKLLRDPSDIKSRGVPHPLCSLRSELTWPNPHQQWASRRKGQSHKMSNT